MLLSISKMCKVKSSNNRCVCCPLSLRCSQLTTTSGTPRHLISWKRHSSIALGKAASMSRKRMDATFLACHALWTLVVMRCSESVVVCPAWLLEWWFRRRPSLSILYSKVLVMHENNTLPRQFIKAIRW